MGGGRPEGRHGGNVERIELEVFATGAATAFAPAECPLECFDPVGQPTFADHLRRGGDAVHHGIDHARELRATPGPRPGRPIATTGERRGGSCDIVRPIYLHPDRACALALGDVFRRPIDHLEITDDSAAADLIWRVVITGSRRVPATLHLRASPSMVVTVLELVPRRTLRWHRDQFVRDGVAAADSLARRLIDAA
jgi:hypothetical protein